MKKQVIAIVGPTGSGKTTIGIELAKILNTEIISADSRQIYKGIGIATAAPGITEMQGIKHHFINEISPEIEFNAGEFSKRARQRINEIFSSGKTPIIVGGSGLYIKALIDGLFLIKITDQNIRKYLYERMEKEGKQSIFNELQRIDAKAAQSMDYTKYRRVIRALEIYYSLGLKISDLQDLNDKPDFQTIQFGLNWERQSLYSRINKRVDKMLSNGLIEEIKVLMDKNYHYKTQNSLNTVGVKEAMQYLENLLSYDKMVSLIKQNSRRYAKRQITWFKKDIRINWITLEEGFDPKRIAKNLIRKIFK